MQHMYMGQMAQIGQIGQMGQLGFMSFGSFLATLFPQIDILMRRLSSSQADQETAVVIKYFSHSRSSAAAAAAAAAAVAATVGTGVGQGRSRLAASSSSESLAPSSGSTRSRQTPPGGPAAAAPCGVDWLSEPPAMPIGNVYRTLGQVLSPASTILAK